MKGDSFTVATVGSFVSISISTGTSGVFEVEAVAACLIFIIERMAKVIFVETDGTATSALN